MKLAWTRLASIDRREVREHIARDNPAAALSLDELFSQKALLLADNPLMGRPGRVSDTREMVAHHNYVLVYDVTADTIRVLRLLHTARQWPPSR